MDVEFMLTDSIEAVRPKLEMPKTLEAAALAVDDMFNTALQAAGEFYMQCVCDGAQCLPGVVGGHSDDSDEDDEDGDRPDEEDEEDEDNELGDDDSVVCDSSPVSVTALLTDAML